jgi:glutathione S-transferase
MITLYGVAASPFVRKVMVVLALKELPYKHILSMPFSNDPELKKISPLGKIPVLQDGELTLTDSKVICRYLENAYGEVQLYPTDPAQKAKAEWFEEYGGTALAESAAGIFFHRFMRPMMLKQDVDEEAVDNLINNKMPPVLDYLESVLPADGFLFGDLGVADTALASPFVNAGYANYTIDAERWPKAAAFVQRFTANSVVAPLLAAERKALGM